MPTKEARILNAIKKKAGEIVSARDISIICNLTPLEVGMKLSELAEKGLIKRIYTNNKDVANYWQYTEKEIVS